MRLTFSHLRCATLLLFAAVCPAVAHASDFDKLTYFTFSGAVQIPGATLPAGTYQFKLANPGSGARVVLVTSQNGKKVYALSFTMSAYRDHGDEAAVIFRETAGGVPPAIREWFYAGEESGYEFVYSRRQALAIAGTPGASHTVTASNGPQAGPHGRHSTHANVSR